MICSGIERLVIELSKFKGINTKTSGSTLVCAVISGSKLVVANVGDSKCIIGAKRGLNYNNMRSHEMTDDHHPDVEEERIRIEATKMVA
jgi:serine/threonine protein phosphatase PrpC